MNFIYFISPVGSDPSYGAKRQALDSIAQELGVKFFFPLDQHNSFSIDTAVTDLHNAWLVIADLSLERPSCYFEVGLAQGIGKTVAFIAAVDTPIHQADRTANLVNYSGIPAYRESIRQIILDKQKECLPSLSSVTSPISLEPSLS